MEAEQTISLPEGRVPELRRVFMPKDTNQYGIIFGGLIMSAIDVAAGIVGSKTCNGRAVTAAVDSLSFGKPVHVGDRINVYARLVSVGRTSMKIEVEVFAERAPSLSEVVEVTKGMLTFVAIDDVGHPRPVYAGKEH
jgi:acyl-CoA thioesterase YciA